MDSPWIAIEQVCCSLVTVQLGKFPFAATPIEFEFIPRERKSVESTSIE